MARLPLVVLVAVTLLVSPAEARRRSVRMPVPLDPSTPHGWLATHAYPLQAVEHVPSYDDLAPLGQLIGDATVVGLGDGTHGSHEFYTVKLRAIEYLVREKNFDVVAFEGPVAQWQQLNAYVLGGAGDPRAVLAETNTVLKYMFWDTEEILALVEWMREYNLRRGDRPRLQLLGTDVHGPVAAWKSVVAYLRTVDPAMAADAERDYACIGESNYPSSCGIPAARVRDVLAGARDRLIPLSSEDAYETALLAARAVRQAQDWRLNYKRDEAMAENALWIRENRSASGRIIYYAHNAHSTKARIEFSSDEPAGLLLRRALADRYYSIGTMTAAGMYMQWEHGPGNTLTSVITEFAPLTSDMHEWRFRQRGLPALLIPLRGELPQWLSEPARFNMAANAGPPAMAPVALPQNFDAVIYIENTTPIRAITH